MADLWFLKESIDELANQQKIANRIAYLHHLSRYGSRGDRLDLDIRESLGLDEE